ncbi:VWA domain-containing protein [Pelobacter seleniigenes]|uniref:VWA domain-containing protein n=1 Tax=Pelobacter seleniigenes TaxID=407188 RepID=UPI0004A6B083|nr:VWA domain-containing protein [Pelobacter seleniigenes]
MSLFHFLRPWWFLLLPPLLVLLWLFWRRRLQSRSWQEICDPQLLPHLLIGRSRRRAHWPLWLLLVGLLLSITALAGPTWRKQPQPLLKQQSALVIALDLSRSMLAADLKPSRLVRARLKIEDILRQRREGQTGLVVFAGDAFAVTPLTDDVHTIQALLGSLDPQLMPVQGSRPARAFSLATELVKRAGLQKGTVLLVTDEDRPELSLDAARELAASGLKLAVLGVGTPEGAPIPLPDGGFFKDSQGNLILPRLAESGLRELAQAGGGDYRRISIDDSDFKALLSTLDSHRLDRAEQGPKRTGDLWQDAGVWLLWPLALLAAAAFRRGWLLVLASLLWQPAPAEAFSWNELWLNQQQQAYQAFANKDYATAAQKFSDPRWQAGSHYRAGDYAKALQALPDPQSADDWYNRGNMLAQSGQLPAALKAYDQALQLDPDSADAQANRKIVEDALKKQQQQQDPKAGGQQQPQGERQQQDKEGQQKQQQSGQSASDKSGQDQAQQQRQQSAAEHSRQPESAERNQADKAPQSAPQPDQANSAPAKQDQAETDKVGDKPPQPASPAAQADDQPQTPEEQQRRQLLQRIPDDPGGLLRRKFLYQYRQRGEQQESERPW